MEGSGAGVLDPDLRRACLAALRIRAKIAGRFALTRSWQAATDEFMSAVFGEDAAHRASPPDRSAQHGHRHPSQSGVAGTSRNVLAIIEVRDMRRPSS